jgi:hypothetical protein
MRLRLGILLTAVGLAIAPAAHAAHHLWTISEAFSNASGSVQFVEMSCPSAGENNIGAFALTSNTHTLNFVTNLNGATSTANSWVLLATSGFNALPGGIAPDYVIPANFFNTGGGTLNYAGIDNWAYGAVPTDGVHSLLRNGSTPVNNPQNFLGQSGSVNLSAPVPALQTWGLLVLVGAMLFAASGLWKKQRAQLTA